MLLNFKYEIIPNGEQNKALHRWTNICCMQYNSALLDKQHAYETSKNSLSKKELSNLLTQSKKQHQLLKEVPSQPLQETLERLKKAFDKFFKKDGGYPKIKSPKDYHSLTFPQFGVQRRMQKGKNVLVRHAVSLSKGGTLRISKLGDIPVIWHRSLPGKVRQCTIKRQHNKWYVVFSCEVKVKNHVHQHDSVGIDVGINKYAVLSDGIEIVNPKKLRKNERKLKKLQRQLSKKKKGSNQYKKQKQKLNKMHMTVANQRKNFLHKLSFHIAMRYKYVVIEDLKIKNMVKNRKLAKSIHDAGWGMFKNMLQYKCERFGGKLIKVKPHYTSVACSNCGTHVKKSLSVRTHICPKCGYTSDRDLNASINILNKGLNKVLLPV